MKNAIPCCGTCSNSCGSGDNLYCAKLIRNVAKYDGCLMYEPKEDEDEKDGSDE
ncbi:MAG: hypothetical protein ACI4J2_01405 [Ruminococcus sp.]